MSRKLLALTLLCLCGSVALVLAAQQPPAKQAPSPPIDLLSEPHTNIVVNVQQVIAPVLVYDRKHNYVNGLTPDQFRLYDNDKEQNLLNVDLSYTPISLVVAIQANVEADKILPQVNKIGAMLKPIILGDQGLNMAGEVTLVVDGKQAFQGPVSNEPITVGGLGSGGRGR